MNGKFFAQAVDIVSAELPASCSPAYKFDVFLKYLVEMEAGMTLKVIGHMIVAVMIFTTDALAAARNYACKDTASVGYAFVDGKWEEGAFKPTQFLLRFDGKKAVTKKDGVEKVYECEIAFVYENPPFLFRCGVDTSMLIFNEKQGAYTYSYGLGGLVGHRFNPAFVDSINISYGECLSFD